MRRAASGQIKQGPMSHAKGVQVLFTQAQKPEGKFGRAVTGRTRSILLVKKKRDHRQKGTSRETDK